MTPKQMYSELAKIAGARCATGEPLVRTNALTEPELRKVQKSLLALMEKLNYRRTNVDFSDDDPVIAQWRDREIRRINSHRRAARAGEVSRVEGISYAQTSNEGVLMRVNPMFTPIEYQPLHGGTLPQLTPLSGDPAYGEIPSYGTGIPTFSYDEEPGTPAPETREENNP